MISKQLIKMNILVVDDHELVREGVIRIITEEFPSATIREACDGISAEKTARAARFDIIIMDMQMPGKTGLEVLKQLRSESNKTPVLILSIHPENQYAIRILKAGGNGYIPKDCARAMLVTAMRLILDGKRYISPEVAEKLASHFDGDAGKERHELISDRELQVLKLIAYGKTVSEIAKELLLSIPTISTYRSRLLEKMNLKNSAELACYAINNHLI